MYLDELTAQERRALVDELDHAVNRIERVVLRVIAQGSGSFGPSECYWSFRTIMGETGLTREYVRAACRSLTDLGLAEFSSMLSDEDGNFRGAGYTATRAGIDLLRGTGTERESVVGSVVAPGGGPENAGGSGA